MIINITLRLVIITTVPKAIRVRTAIVIIIRVLIMSGIMIIMIMVTSILMTLTFQES